MCGCVCNWVQGLERLSFCLSCLLWRSAGAAVSGLPHGLGGVAPAPRFQLYMRCTGPCRARGGCRAPVSGASVAQRCDVSVLCWLEACTAAWLAVCYKETQ